MRREDMATKKKAAITLEFDYEDIKGVLAYIHKREYTEDELREIADGLESELQSDWFDLLYERMDNYIIEDDE